MRHTIRNTAFVVLAGALSASQAFALGGGASIRPVSSFTIFVSLLQSLLF
jgi:hypothetical protein